MLDWILIGIQGLICTFQGVMLYRKFKYGESYNNAINWSLTAIVLIIMFVVIFNNIF